MDNMPPMIKITKVAPFESDVLDGGGGRYPRAPINPCITNSSFILHSNLIPRSDMENELLFH